MNKIYYLIMAFTTLVSFVSCGNDGELDSKSIFPDGVDTSTQNDFDRWVLNNYTYPYNIQFEYRYSDKEAHVEYNVVPAEYDKSIAVAKLVKHLWVDAYNELLGRDFLRQYSPRMIQLIGSSEYKEDMSEVLGTAEGGMKIFLNKVNLLGSSEALKMGYISAYASSEPGEDFVEILSFYVVYGKPYWEKMLELAGDSGSPKLLKKFALVKEYLSTKWSIDIDELEKIVQRRMGDISELDLESLD